MKYNTNMDEIRSDGESKLAELILYISQKCSLDPKFGAIKLNKILCFSDFTAYGKFGHGITGVPYCHREFGPAPERFIPIRRYLESTGALLVRKVPLRGGKEQHRTVALRDPDLALFSRRELAVIDGMIDSFHELDADESSELSHQLVGWKITDMDETIPYASVFLSDQPLSDGEMKRASELVAIARQRGLPVELTAS